MKPEYARMLHIISLFAHFSQNVKYWYEIQMYVRYWCQFFTCSEELVPIFPGVKFSKCEIRGSARLSIEYRV